MLLCVLCNQPMLPEVQGLVYLAIIVIETLSYAALALHRTARALLRSLPADVTRTLRGS